MIVNIDFTIFSSPVKAHGNVTGKIEVLKNHKIGDFFEILNNDFSIKLKIISINILDQASPVILGLDDVVFSSVEEAEGLVNNLEKIPNIFFDKY